MPQAIVALHEGVVGHLNTLVGVLVVHVVDAVEGFHMVRANQDRKFW